MPTKSLFRMTSSHNVQVFFAVGESLITPKHQRNKQEVQTPQRKNLTFLLWGSNANGYTTVLPRGRQSADLWTTYVSHLLRHWNVSSLHSNDSEYKTHTEAIIHIVKPTEPKPITVGHLHLQFGCFIFIFVVASSWFFKNLITILIRLNSYFQGFFFLLLLTAQASS